MSERGGEYQLVLVGVECGGRATVGGLMRFNPSWSMHEMPRCY